MPSQNFEGKEYLTSYLCNISCQDAGEENHKRPCRIKRSNHLSIQKPDGTMIHYECVAIYWSYGIIPKITILHVKVVFIVKELS